MVMVGNGGGDAVVEFGGGGVERSRFEEESGLRPEARRRRRRKGRGDADGKLEEKVLLFDFFQLTVSTAGGTSTTTKMTAPCARATQQKQ